MELLKLPNLQIILKIHSGSAGRQRKGFSQKREKREIEEKTKDLQGKSGSQATE